MKPSAVKPEPRSRSVPGSGVAEGVLPPIVPEPTELNAAGGSPISPETLAKVHAPVTSELHVSGERSTLMPVLPEPESEPEKA